AFSTCEKVERAQPTVPFGLTVCRLKPPMKPPHVRPFALSRSPMFLFFDDITAVGGLFAAIVQTSPVGSRSPIIVKPPAESGIALGEVPPVTTAPLFWPETTSI